MLVCEIQIPAGQHNAGHAVFASSAIEILLIRSLPTNITYLNLTLYCY